MGLLGDSGPYGSPNNKPQCPGQTTLQAMSEAQDRCEQRRKWREDHPDEMGPDDWAQISQDYEDIEHGQNLFGSGGARTFEPGDGLVSRRGK